MHASLSLSLSLLLLPALAHAHGIVSSLIVDGTTFKGDLPNAAANPSVIRQVSDASPVKGATNAFVNCGFNAGPAALVADAMPGSVVQFDWTAADLNNWPHNTGPMLTYMASCGSSSCAQFDSTTAKWFKIEQAGRFDNGTWAQAALMLSPKNTASVTLPSNLAPGNYLIRHEIIALHLAMNPGGAEFYPSCSQLRVGGSGTGKPANSELVSLPGAYSDNDPGILVNAYDTSVPYVFPGPPIAAFVSAGAGSSGDSGSANSSSSTKAAGTKTTSSAGATKTAAAPSSTASKVKQCKLKKSSSAAVPGATQTLIVRPRHVSRIMRGLAFGSGH